MKVVVVTRYYLVDDETIVIDVLHNMETAKALYGNSAVFKEFEVK